jgi:transposase
MAKTRREFTPEFKREAVALLQSSGRPLTQIAAEIGIQPSMLRSRRSVQNGGPARSRVTGTGAGPTAAATPIAPSPADQAAEVARLRRELDRVRTERDILKKAIGIFSETPR